MCLATACVENGTFAVAGLIHWFAQIIDVVEIRHVRDLPLLRVLDLTINPIQVMRSVA